MNQTNNGSDESAKSRLTETKYDEIRQLINQYLADRGLNNNSFREGLKEEIQDYLKLSPTVISKLSAEQCGEISIQLLQYSLFLLQEQNKETATINWLEATISKAIAMEIGQIEAFKYEEKVNKAIKQNGYARTLNDLKIAAKLRCDTLSYMSSYLKSMSDRFEKQAEIKKRYN